VIGPLALGLLALAGQAAPGAAPSSSVRPFEAVWAEYVAADAASDSAGEARAMREIRRARIERNVDSLDSVGLALVGHGYAKLKAGQRDDAEQEFRAAVALAPGLPDAHAGLSLALLRKGPLAIASSLDASASGIQAFLATGRGARSASDLLTLGALIASLAAAWAIAGALVVRHGGLLLHDIEEWLGPAHHRSASLALFLLLLLLPVATFQGWGWLPLWWLALLFSYFDVAERALAGVLAVSALFVGPGVAQGEERLRTARNPLYHAALAATESVPDDAAIRTLEAALQQDPADRDLVYLVGAARKKAGRFEEAAELYRQALAADPQDALARNNLANLEFARASYDAASARYRAGTSSTEPAVAATSHYNLSLAHLQKFDYQAYGAAKSAADRLAPGLVAEYDRWKFDTGEYAVADLGLQREQVFAKFAGADRCAGAGAPQPLLGLARRVRPRRVPGRALARAQGLHPALPPLRHRLLPAVPPRPGERRALLAVLSLVRGARRRLRAGSQPQAGGRAELRRATGEGRAPGVGRFAGRRADLLRLDALRRALALRLVRHPGPGRGEPDRTLHRSAAGAVAALVRDPGRDLARRAVGHRIPLPPRAGARAAAATSADGADAGRAPAARGPGGRLAWRSRGRSATSACPTSSS
jgi:Flp pilus assembly protein TadD